MQLSIQPNLQLHDQQSPQPAINLSNYHLPIDLTQYQQASSQQLIVEFARNSYPLVGGIIQGNTIRGQFGYGEIQLPRNERLVLLQGGKVRQVQKVAKIIIVKSLVNCKKNQVNKITLMENENLFKVLAQKNQTNQQNPNQLPNPNNKPSQSIQSQNPLNPQHIHHQQRKSEPQQADQEQRFFSQSSESSIVEQRQRRQAKNLLKKQQSISKDSNHNQKPSKISKNILKKKLKYLAQKK